MQIIPQKEFMEQAITEAKQSFERDDYPIGACIVKNGKIIASAGNRVKTKIDSTRHAEIELIKYVVGMHHGSYIEDCILYTTHEPCPMCAAACVWAKIGGIVYGNTIDDFKKYTDETNYYKWRIIDIPCSVVTKNTPIQVIGPFMQSECNELFTLQDSKK